MHCSKMMMMLVNIIKPCTSSSSCCCLRSIKRMMSPFRVQLFYLLFISSLGYLTRIFTTLRQMSPFRVRLLYLLFISLLGYLALIFTTLRLDPSDTGRLGSLDAAFMSISAVTSSSMSTVEMEGFTNAQLIFFIILMFLGGEVFMSMLGLFLQSCNILKATSAASVPDSTNPSSLAEIGCAPNDQEPKFDDDINNQDNFRSFTQQKAIKTLAYLVLAYLTFIHFFGSLSVYLYMITVPSAAHVLKSKSILPSTFSIFLTASSFANCGFVPTNENMAVFKNNSLLLLLVIPQVLMGNTFYPICIRVLIRLIEYLFGTESKHSSSLYTFILSNPDGVGIYDHLLSSEATWWLGWTGLGFLVSQVVMLAGMDWGSQAFAGMTWFQSLVACLFQSVSSRHSGESVFDLSTLSTAVLVLFILMMYFPPYLTFMPGESDPSRANPARTTDEEELARRRFQSDSKNKKLLRITNLELSYLAICVILISITERNSLKTDPLNFNLLNILIEVISAYGNVGFSMGYSCKRRVEQDSFCRDKTYGFAGRWTDNGKLILIVVMIFGKLKRFNHKGGTSWKCYDA